MLVKVNDIKFKLREDEYQIIAESFEEDPYKIEDVERDGLVIDLGAHIGTFAIRCAVERNCKVLAFEPCPSTFELLAENIKLNDLDGKVIPFRSAIGDTVGIRKFYSRPNHPVSSSLYLHHYSMDVPGYLTQEVQCTTLKRVFEDNNVSECVALKIDCEEAEKEIFIEESKPYFRKTKYVALEWHFYDGGIYRDYLSELGFSTHLTGCGNPPPPYEMTFGRGYLYAWRLK